MNNHLEELAVARSAEEGFSSFNFDYSAMTFPEAFEVYDSVRTNNGPSKWGYSEGPVEGHQNSIAQTSEIVGLAAGQGTYAMLKNHRFFDTVFSADFLARGSGIVGVTFRMKDFNNMFMLEINQKEKATRLLKIVDGEVHKIAESLNGGYLKEKWFHTRIETTQGQIKVSVGEKGQKLVDLFKFVLLKNKNMLK